MSRARTAMIAIALSAIALLASGASAASASFGLTEPDVTFTGPTGEPEMQAGSHPDALNVSFGVNVVEEVGGVFPDESPKDVLGLLPAGFVADPNATPSCSGAEFASIDRSVSLPECSDASAVGVAHVRIGILLGTEIEYAVPVYNLEPAPGSVLKLGFVVYNVPVTISGGLSDKPPYNAIGAATNITQAVPFYGTRLTLWGDPADPAHDPIRGSCIKAAEPAHTPGGINSNGECPVSIPERAFLTLPTRCTGPLVSTFEADSWQHPGPPYSYREEVETHDALTPPSPLGTHGCAGLNFKPAITAKPTTLAAESPTGLDFSLNVHDEGLTNPTGVANSEIRKAVVTLPEGFTTNPSIAEGLNVCTEAELARETPFSSPGDGCPEASKVGNVEVESPLLEEHVNGSLYIAKPYENPFGSLLALYMVIRNPKLGIVVQQPLKVEPNPLTGRLTTVAEELPQLPFSHFRLHFREGARSPLASPPACGSYAVEATLYPWSGGAPQTSSSTFEIITGPEGQPCPSGGLPPFHPGLIAGTLNNAAGSYSPFLARIFRSDSEQEITHFSIKLPPGLTGKLAGIPFCPDAAIAAAKAREAKPNGGGEELEQPSCPAASYVGRTLVGAGVGSSLTYAPGKLYLAGPYNGSPLSIVAITAAKVGPFDLGTVVVREALRINPETAEVSVDATGSDPIPHIIAGIPVHLRDIRVYADRPQFVLNPTNCEPTSTASTVLGSGLDFASEADDNPVTVTTRFQAADCASLAFKPRLTLTLSGKTHRGGLPKLKAVLNTRSGDANIGRAAVTLPASEILEQGHLENVCPKSIWTQGSVPGEKCPADSIYGHARAITPLLDEPLEGPVYLRTGYGTVLPELVAALNSGKINIDAVGEIDAVVKKGSEISRLRTTFKTVPDAPVTKFVLQMEGGAKGLLTNTTNICAKTHKADALFTGQNGRVDRFHPAVKTAGCKRSGKKRHR